MLSPPAPAPRRRSYLGEGRLGDLRVRAFKLDKAFREVLVVMQKVSGPVGAGAYPALA
jgi:hypothetical protein